MLGKALNFCEPTDSKYKYLDKGIRKITLYGCLIVLQLPAILSGDFLKHSKKYTGEVLDYIQNRCAPIVIIVSLEKIH